MTKTGFCVLIVLLVAVFVHSLLHVYASLECINAVVVAPEEMGIVCFLGPDSMCFTFDIVLFVCFYFILFYLYLVDWVAG